MPITKYGVSSGSVLGLLLFLIYQKSQIINSKQIFMQMTLV